MLRKVERYEQSFGLKLEMKSHPRLLSVEAFGLSFAEQTHFFFSIFAHVSFRLTVRLNTSLPGALSTSTQKYPCRSN